MRNYSDNIRAIRARKRLTQSYVAQELGIDYTTYGKIENGKSTLSVEKLVSLAKIFDVSVNEIIEGIPDTVNEPQEKYLKRKKHKIIIQIEIDDTQKEKEILKMILGEEGVKQLK